ncbi:MAG: MFS transporter, partial [Chitinivibrionales bacterium]|nr:MFS transporter [Chitinivibrionales bacterium]MBD3395273.1 MFS transporter [Chitinivibrionales bacterium]
GTVMTALLSLIGEGRWQLALAVFVAANIGWTCANLFYDSLLTCVAPRNKLDFVSSLGFSIGYLGCGLLFLLNIAMVQFPSFFGLSGRTQAVKASFLTVAAWWLVFAIPLLFFVREYGEKTARGPMEVVFDGFRRLRQTFGEIRRYRHIWLFLLAYWLYIDGVDTVIRMAADLGMAIGLDSGSLMISLLIVQFVAFPAALLFGFAAERIGVMPSLMIGIGIYIVVTVVGPLWVHTEMQFRIMAALNAVPLGCLQALSRSYYARLIPEDRSAEFFGFYNLMGKFAAIFGPAMVGSVAFLFERKGASTELAARFGFFSITVLFIAGGALLFVAGKAAARGGISGGSG